ncbi:MAG: protein kinase [Kofleriaceae bacterium]|nr:protein kinase [Kofleriaceae bacterium]
MSAGDPLLGRTLGDFVVRERLAAGAFGEVYVADQPVLERQVVVKIARHDGAPTAVQQFLAEARLASRLDHPFAAHVYGFGAEADGLLWIAMERVRGTPLDELVDGGPLPLARAVPLLRRLCEVVQAAHELGLIHRDIKPGNVLVVARAGSLYPKLLDFGLARDHAALAAGDAGTSAGSGAGGTPLYMAPEAWVGGAAVGPAVDLYALGAVAYQLLAGRPPFQGRTVRELAMHHARTAPPPLPDAVPAQVGAAVTRALAKRAAERFPTALAFADALIETSGITLEVADLPRLDEPTRDDALARAPQPIADAVADLDAAADPAVACAALWAVADTIAHVVGVVALACARRIGGGRAVESPELAALTEQLRRTGLDGAGLWRLAREATRPLAAVPAVHPLPELVALFFDGAADVTTALDQLHRSRDRQPGARDGFEAQRTFLLGVVPVLARAVRAVEFLSAYSLVAPRPGEPTAVEAWMGVSRRTRPRLARPADADVLPGPALIDPAGGVVATLGPWVELAEPAPGQPPTLFWVIGPGRRGARLITRPERFTRESSEVWPHDDAAASAAATSPYLGLSTFTAADAGLFFGREREVEAVVNRLAAQSLLAVVGPSGAGKSSFVQAGVLPALGPRWQVVVVRPGPTPLASLAARLGAAGLAVDAAALSADPGALRARLASTTRADGAGLVLVVDQFEELFTLCLDPDEQAAYAAAIVGAADDADPHLRVMLTVRDDFLIRAAQLPALRGVLAARLTLVTTPAADELRRILVEPARRAGFTFEDDALATEMVDEVATKPGALALLSFTASRLWQLRDGATRQLTRKAYRALGGVGGALAQHAEATMAALPAAHQPAVREMFRHLVTADGTRAVLSRAELLQVAGGETAAPALEALIHARLLTAMEDAARGESIEVVHETLLAAWPRLVGWRQQDAETARLRDQLRVAARQWASRGRPRGLLWRDEALAEYQLWRARYPGALTTDENDFGRASVAVAARGRRLRRGALVTVLVALSVALVVFARLRTTAVASERRAAAGEERAVRSEAERRAQLLEARVDQGRRALLAGDHGAAEAALAEAQAAGKDDDDVRFMLARARAPGQHLVATLRGHQGPASAVLFTPDGGGVISAGSDGTLRRWDLTGRELAQAAAHPAGTEVKLALLPGGEVLSAAADGQVRLWASADLRPLRAFAGHPSRVIEIAVAGDLVALAGIDGAASLCRVGAGTCERIALEPAGLVAITTVDLSTDGRALIMATSRPDLTGQAVVIDLARNTRRVLPGAGAAHTRVRFAPDVARLALGSEDNTASLWSRSGAPVATLAGHLQRVYALAFTPDSQQLITGGSDGAIRVWDGATGAVRRGLDAHRAEVTRLRVVDDHLFSTSADGTANVWDLASSALTTTVRHGSFIRDLALRLDDDGAPDLMATAGWDGLIDLWQVEGPTSLHTFARAAARDQAPPLLSRDGQVLVRASAAGVERWDLAKRRRSLLGPAGAAAALGPGPGGEQILVADGGTVQALGLDATPAWRHAVPSPVRALAASPRPPHQVALLLEGGALALLDPNSGALTAQTTTGQLDGWPIWNGAALVVAGPGGGEVFDGASLARRGATPGIVEAPMTQADGDDLALRSQDGNRLVLLRDGIEHAAINSAALITAWAWGPDGLMFGTRDGTLEWWSRDGRNRQRVVKGHDSRVYDLTSRDGLAASIDAAGIIRFWSRAGLLLFERRGAVGYSWITLAAGRLVLSSAPSAAEILTKASSGQ